MNYDPIGWAESNICSKAAPPPGGHIFQQTENIFKLSLSIIKTNDQTKFHEDWTLNVTPRELISKTALPPGVHVFLPIRTIFKLNRRIQDTNFLTKFHEDWTKNVTSRVFICFHIYTYIENCPAPGGLVFSPIWTIFELVRDIIETNVLTKFHDVWAKIMGIKCNFYSVYKVFLSLTYFELGRGIIGTNVLTKFHEDRTINVASRVLTRQMLTTDARRTKGDHNS
ncbi:hypothetical protein DPMN_179799 [Dreissena polymorpha]|uniref:Uncharacterized protein n=1 Tax=Dreissena polymorpha TaxID=45954 RepID=A0A9D4ED11_DREPO|nr:hypothetical protein DPMN_179799 [Dreissena polymorpha]